MKIKLLVFYIFIYVVLFFFTLNFNYIEGDDAYTIMHHALGRDRSFQPPYSSYHGMFDTFLTILTTSNEVLLRHISIGVSFVFGFASLLLIAFISMLKTVDIGKSSFFVLLLLPFIIPEILFSSLLVNPSSISFTFLLLAHLFLLKYVKQNRLILLVYSLVAFGIGVSFRWINGFYLFVLFGDYILNEGNKIRTIFLLKRLKNSVLIFPFYIISLLIFIQLSGYSLFDIFDTFNSGVSTLKSKETSYLSLGATALSFLTPSLFVLLILGIFYSVKMRTYRTLIWLVIATLPYFIVSFLPSYKYMINIIVVLVILSIQGFSVLSHNYLKYGMVFLIFIVWILGFQLETNSAWGPGFEVVTKPTNQVSIENYNPDKSVKINKIKPVFGSGMAMPTLEGPRPIYGYGDVFFKKWFAFVETHNNKREQAVLLAKQNNCRILQDVGHSLIYTKLLEFGYNTNHKYDRIVGNMFERDFYKNNDSIIVNVVQGKNKLFDDSIMEDYLSKNKKVVVYSKYSNIISKLKTKYKDKFELKGGFLGVLYK